MAQFKNIPISPTLPALKRDQQSERSPGEDLHLIDKRCLLYRPFPAAPVLLGPEDDGELPFEQKQAVPLATHLLAVIQATTILLPVVAGMPAKRGAGRGAILWSSPLAAGVFLVYLVTPLVFTLAPFLPANWSRVLIVSPVLFSAELLIYRILQRTTSKSNLNKVKGRAR